MIKLVLLATAVLLSWSPPLVAQGDTFDLKEWPVEWGGRTRDPAIAPERKSSPVRSLWVLVGGFAGFLFSLVVVFIRSTWRAGAAARTAAS